MNLYRLFQSLLLGSVILTCVMAAPGSRAGASSATIGIATAGGTFKLDSVDVEGNANLFEGSQLKTGKAASEIFLKGGVVLTLSAASSATLYTSHAVLWEGTTRISNMGSYSVQASQYEIRPDTPATQSVVRLTGNEVQVAAITGSVSILDRKGALLTHVGAGTASAFYRNPGGKGPAVDYVNHARTVVLYTALVVASAGVVAATDAILQTSPRSAISP